MKDLLARKHPQGALSDVLEELLDDYINRHDPMVKARRKAEASEKREAMQRAEASKKREAMQKAEASETVRASGRPGAKKSVEAPVTVLSRYIPMAVKHARILREGWQCTYISPQGVRCGATRHLEWDHVLPFALGGSSTEPGNVRISAQVTIENAHGKPLVWQGG